MTRPSLSLVPSTAGEIGPRPRQMSLPAPRLRLVASGPAGVKANLATLWGRFCLATFADAQDCAAFFGVTRQCAWNWMESDLHRPSGHHVAYAIGAFGSDGPVLAAYLAGPVNAPAPRLQRAPQAMRRVA